MRRFLAAAALLLLSGCVRLDFSRKVDNPELILRGEIRSYFDQVAAAFAAGNADALANLFDPGVARPMTRDQILAWGRDFFHQHGPARFKIEKLEFERVGHVGAVVLLTYKVETSGGKGDFGGVERDEMVKRGGRWYVSGWEKLP